jgi:hypothetical protein
LASTLILQWISGGFSGVVPDTATFKRSVLYYMILKAFLALFCSVLAFAFLDDRQALSHSKALQEETQALGFSAQMKLLMTNKIYLMFVYGPMLSVCLISATDNHFGKLLSPFGITNVRNPSQIS